jgi:glycosyltransferase involved in cell wall biosynthesis
VTAGARSLRIVTVAPLRFPIARPFAGGLESAVWNEVETLRARGHRVELIATEGSDHLAGGRAEFVLPPVDWRGAPEARDDTYPPDYLDGALPALDRALDSVRDRASEYDVVLNHCLQGLPLERAGDLGVSMISTLHTPVLPDLVEAHDRARGRRSRFLSVSGHTSRTWGQAGIASTVLHNGVDSGVWREGPGGSGLVWFGRIVREKAPHLALEIAHRADLDIVLAGRIGDAPYFETEVQPLLDDRRRYVGPLDTDALVRLVGSSGCVVTTPLWEEPFGLVTPEALLCGTPVAGFSAGGVAEVAGDVPGVVLVPQGDLDGLAAGARHLLDTTRLDPTLRRRIRTHAEARFSLDRRVQELEGLLAGDAGRADGRADAR